MSVLILRIYLLVEMPTIPESARVRRHVALVAHLRAVGRGRDCRTRGG
jgi:hypothetical protein